MTAFNIDYIQMIKNIAAESAMDGPIWQMITGACYVMALLLLIKSAFQLRDVAEQKMHGHSAPLLTFVSACLLAAAPEALVSVMVTVFGDGTSTSILQYTPAEAADSPVKAVITIIQLIGYIFFVRGILELRRAGEPQRFQGASINKAVTIMLSGMAAIYINYTLKTIGSFSGWNVDAILN